MNCNNNSFSYVSTTRAAHDLAGLLKRVRPELDVDVAALQCIVTNSHRQMEKARTAAEIAAAWGNLNATYQTLLDLRKIYRA